MKLNSNKIKKVLITGCSGLVGIHLVKKCLQKGYDVVGVDVRYSKNLPIANNFTFYELDLTLGENLKNLFFFETPDVVFNAFGIKGSPMKAKHEPVDFLYPSLKINTEIINQCALMDIWLIFVSSVGVYAAADKFIEENVWKTLPGEADWFPAWSKRVGEILLDACKVQYGYDKWSIIRPANIFGEYDDFNAKGTVIASTIKKVYDAVDTIEAWGDGTPIRDFVYAGDVANAIIKLYENKLHTTINFGSGEEICIKEIIKMIIKVSNKSISIVWDNTKPNGDLKRLMDTTKQKKYGLEAEIKLNEAIKKVYEYYSNSINSLQSDK
jgi:GDP-L-fucose synthase